MIIPPEFLNDMYGRLSSKGMSQDKLTSDAFVQLFNKVLNDRQRHLIGTEDVFNVKIGGLKLEPNYNLTCVAKKVFGKTQGEKPEAILPLYTSTFDIKELP